MTETAAVKFELDSSLKNWTKFTSPKVTAAGFEWFMSGEYIGCGSERINFIASGYNYSFEDAKFALRNAVIHCSPVVEEKKTSIWSCEANGEIVAFARVRNMEAETSSSMSHSKHWSDCFSFHNPVSGAMKIDFHQTFSELHMFYVEIDRERMYSKLEFRVNVTSQAKFDVCSPQNEMIESADDAAKMIVDGRTLWLSKKVLGSASPFFFAYFNNDFKEKLAGEFPLTDVKLHEFLRYVAIVYGVRIDIDKASLKYLLRLEDLYQCEAVRTKCHAFLLATNRISHREKLQLGDRFRFEDVTELAIEKMKIQELTAVGREMQPETYSRKTSFNILRTILERHLIF